MRDWAVRTVGTGLSCFLLIVMASPSRSALLSPGAREVGSHGESRSPISLSATAGWNDRFRPGASWLPVRVTLGNHAVTDIQGSVVTPSGQSVYSLSVLLPAGSTKQVTLHLPGSDVQQELDVSFRVRGRTLAGVRLFPIPFDDGDLTIGALTSDQASLAWLDRVRVPRGHISLTRLSPAQLDPVPEELAVFDLIVVTNTDASRLDSAQGLALERYVRDGGGLLLVGGPDWQETLQPLPAVLVPGQLSGARTISRLVTRSLLVAASPPRQAAVVSLLRWPRGSVPVEVKGIPLVVREALGVGQIEYIAFDPAVAPFPDWKRATGLLTSLITGASPQTVRRLSLPPGYQGVSFLGPGDGPLALTTSLANAAVTAIRTVIPVLVLVILYVVLLFGVAIIMRRSRRPERLWISLPMSAGLFLGVISVTATQLRAHSITLNTIGMVLMDGNSGVYPADLYVGVTAPEKSVYHLTYGAAALPSTIFAPTGAGTATSHASFEEGARTVITLPFAGPQSHASVALRTAVVISGSLRADIRGSPSGDLVGTVENGTKYTLLHPVLIAGRAWTLLPDLASRARLSVRIHPFDNVHQHTFLPVLFKAYGEQLPPFGGAPLPAATTLADRIRDAISALPEASIITMLSETALVAWTDQPLGTFTAAGRDIDLRSLILLVKPVDVQFADGPFRLRTGTLGAHLVDGVPALPLYPCCGPAAQSVYVGEGGAGIFEFDLPAGKRFTFRRLVFDIYGGGAVSTYTEYTDMPPGVTSLYNWSRSRWVGFRFRRGETEVSPPNEYISPTGAVMVKIAPPYQTVDITITDPHQDLQLSAVGVAR